MLTPGLSDAWMMRTRTSEGDFKVGVTRLGARFGTFEGLPATVCVHARIVEGTKEVILGRRLLGYIE
jgi:hypothetical protein